MTTHKHETRKLSDLTIHPLLKDSPMLGGDHPDVKNLMAAMIEEGLADNPIIINSDNQIMDGRHRHKAATLLEWTEIPVIVKPETAAINIIFHALLARRHMYKWQIAYSLAPVIEMKAKQGVSKRVGNLIPGNKSGVKNDEKPQSFSNSRVRGNDESSTLFREQAGISNDVWSRVQEIRKRFDLRMDLKALYEPRMFLPDGDPQAISLEGVMKAIGSVESYEKNKHDLKALRGQHDRLALDLMKKAGAQLEFFEKLEPAKQKKLAEETVQAVRLWPMELKKELLSALQQDFDHDMKSTRRARS
jgi:hypothetical protein